VPLDGGTTKVHCWRFQPGAVDARPVLVLLHGFRPPATWQWRRQVGPLSRRFRLIVTDLLFLGGSSTSVGTRISEVQQAEAGWQGKTEGAQATVHRRGRRWSWGGDLPLCSRLHSGHRSSPPRWSERAARDGRRRIRPPSAWPARVGEGAFLHRKAMQWLPQE
jgi:pimeloyl-ACP methyl ester carboxylesterase